MWRRILASILVVVGVLLLLASGYGWWAKRYFLDSERFSSKATKILDQTEVQDAARARDHRPDQRASRAGTCRSRSR